MKSTEMLGKIIFELEDLRIGMHVGGIGEDGSLRMDGTISHLAGNTAKINHTWTINHNGRCWGGNCSEGYLREIIEKPKEEPRKVQVTNFSDLKKNQIIYSESENCFGRIFSLDGRYIEVARDDLSTGGGGYSQTYNFNKESSLRDLYICSYTDEDVETKTILKGVTMEKEVISKKDGLFCSFSLKRVEGGIQFKIKSDEVESFFRGISSGETVSCSTVGWAEKKYYKTEAVKLPSDRLFNEMSQIGKGFPTFDSEHINLSVIRAVGIKEGLEFTFKGVFSKEQLVKSIEQIKERLKVFYVNYIQDYNSSIEISIKETN